MTRDQIMHLANSCAGQHWMDEAHIQRFAALVAEAEREACAKVCEAIATETYGMTKLREYGECAYAIRARGQPLPVQPPPSETTPKQHKTPKTWPFPPIEDALL